MKLAFLVLATVAALVPPVQARVRGITALTGFNGGKSQIQASDIASGEGYPTINRLKLGTSWITNAGTPSDGTIFDGNGYPTSIPVADGKFTTSFFIELSRDTDIWVAACDGNGSILVNGTTTNSSGGNIRYTFTPNTTAVNFAITAVGTPGTDYPQNCRFIDANDEALYTANVAAGKSFGGFNPTYLSTLRAGGWGVFRFMDLQNANATNVALWTHRKPINYVYYAGGEYRPAYWTAVTVSGATSITGALGSGGPSERQVAQFKWTATVKNPVAVTVSLSNPTQVPFTSHGLSVGDTVAWTGTGTTPAPFSKATVAAQTVYYVQSVVDANTITLSATNGGSVITMTNIGSGTNILSPVIQFKSNSGASVINVADERGTFPMQQGFNSEPVSGSDVTLVYDAGLNLWLKFGTPGTANTRGYLDNGWPYEAMVELCNEAGMHPYFNLPFLAANIGTPANKIAGGTDFVTGLASYVKTNGSSWMVPRFEGPNEEWNPSFYAFTYDLNKGAAFGGWSVNNVYGANVSIMGQAVNAVYGGAVDGTKYQALAGVQTHSTSPSSNTTNAANDRFNSPSFVAAGGSAAKNWLTHGDVDGYVSPAASGMNQEFQLASDYAVNGTVADLNAFVDTMSNGGSPPNGNFNLDFMNALYVQWQPYFASFTNKDGNALKTTQYEGGYNVVYTTTTAPSSTITAISATNPAVLTLPVSSIPFSFNTSLSGARVTGFISGTTLTVQSLANGVGTLRSNIAVTGPGVAANTYIISGSGTTGNYTLNNSQTVGSAGSPISMSIGNVGNPAVVGMQVVISGAGASCAALNGNTYNITAVSGDSVTINADATSCGSFSGTATATYQLNNTVTGTGLNVLNLFRRASKSASHVQGYTYGGVSGSQSNYGNFAAAGGEFPSQFNFAGSAYSPAYQTGIAINSANSWGMYDPDIYGTPSTAQAGIAAFNAH